MQAGRSKEEICAVVDAPLKFLGDAITFKASTPVKIAKGLANCMWLTRSVHAETSGQLFRSVSWVNGASAVCNWPMASLN